MKKLLILPFLFLALFVNAQANYQTALTDALTKMKTANTAEEMQSVANQCSRIVSAEPKEWLPNYYAAYTNITLTFLLKDDDQRDQVLDKAQTFLDRALKLQPKESELYVLQGYLHQARLVVSPMMRGMKYSGLASTALEKAKTLNPNNPRVYFLLGQNAFNTPKMFGGGTDVAKPILAKAKEKYATQKPANALLPNWGESRALALLAKCN
ncbi:hypothetical protein EFA69_11875 [Rufibacter immobilis]|uniref:Tetratricopeptide repeat protein n=1 Tax=Rufibacter immobilis TaxID=1348778 RepID=A0A3M9MXG0_9BACT|nr:hypothetical protein [Rufibacter immobilis]RNI30190.1 hypothetical protein EFA69_11875 [Rufibacter immobilis]